MLVQDWMVGKPAKKRHKDWNKVRTDILYAHSWCAVCGNRSYLNVHHILPFHLFPELELETRNLIVLCEKSERNVNCHYVFGHLGLSWKHYNEVIKEDAKYLFNMFRNAKK